MKDFKESDLEGITKDDLQHFSTKISSLKYPSKQFAKLLESYFGFRLQLVAIAGGTFSIYIALQSGGIAPGIYTKYGFVALAASLFVGLISIAVSFVNKASSSYFEIFDFDKDADGESDGFKKLMSLMGLQQGLYYDKWYKKMELSEHGQKSTSMTRHLMTSGMAGLSLWLGIAQIIAFVVATGLLLVGLLVFEPTVHRTNPSSTASPSAPS